MCTETSLPGMGSYNYEVEHIEQFDATATEESNIIVIPIIYFQRHLPLDEFHIFLPFHDDLI